MASTGDARARRILIIVENLPVPFDRRVWNEATTLTKAGYDVSVICPKALGYNESVEELDGVHIYRHPLPDDASGALGYLKEYSLALFWQFLLTWKVFFGRGFDAIHACNPPDLIFIVGGFFKIFFGKKFVYDHHDLAPELYEAKFERRDFFYKALLGVERWTYATADMAIATNDSYKEIAITRGRMDPEKVTVVRSGPNVDRMQIMPPVPEIKKGKTYLVGYVGVIAEPEGLDLLLESVRHITEVRGRHDVHFAIMGGGPELDKIRALASEMGLDEYVTLTGRVSDEDLLKTLNTADVCVNPDRPSDQNDKSTMNKILEYMALGKPIVQYDLKEGRYSAQGASLYAVKNDTADFGDKILELLDDPAARERMGRIGRDRLVSELSWEHQAPKLIDFYDRLFKRKRRSVTEGEEAHTSSATSR